MEAPRLRLGIFGYSGKSVRLVLADRDRQLIRYEERLRQAEDRICKAEETVALRERLHDVLRAEIAAARRDFLSAHKRASVAEAKLLEPAAEPLGRVIVLPDLEAAANGLRPRARSR
jgi:hypothetical protein